MITITVELSRRTLTPEELEGRKTIVRAIAPPTLVITSLILFWSSLLLFSISSFSGVIRMMMRMAQNQAKDTSPHLVLELLPRGVVCSETTNLSRPTNLVSLSLRFTFLSHLHSLSRLWTMRWNGARKNNIFVHFGLTVLFLGGRRQGVWGTTAGSWKVSQPSQLQPPSLLSSDQLNRLTVIWSPLSFPSCQVSQFLAFISLLTSEY